jgi:hypothetical protein
MHECEGVSVARYQVYLDKVLDAAMHEYAEEHHGGVVNAALRELVVASLRLAGYPRPLTEAAVRSLMEERRLKKEENRLHVNELQRKRRRVTPRNRGRVRRYEE